MTASKKASSDDQLPVIKHIDGEMPRALDETEAAVFMLGDAGPYVFQGRPCRVYVAPAPERGVISRPAGAVRMHAIDTAHMRELATKAARHYKWDKRAKVEGAQARGDWRQIDCPKHIAEALLSRGNWPGWRVITGVVEAPTISPEGGLIDSPGYHRSGLFLTARPKDWKSPSLRPTRDEALEGIEVLRQLYADFPFVSEADLAAMFAALMTVLVRRSLPAAPMIGITAPSPGTGKTLGADTLAIAALNRRGSMLALGKDENETEKRLYSVLLAGDSLVIVDNVEQPLGGVLLCQLLTQPSVQHRVLSTSTILNLQTNCTLVATGNNLSIVGDLRRRAMLIRMDAKTERPERRSFARDALAYCHQHRAAIIRAALAVMLSYIAAGRPSVGKHPFGGFTEWDRLVRAPLVWLGLPDPLIPAEGLRETDPDLETTKALFSAWRAVFQDRGATVAEAIAAAREYTHRFDGGKDPVNPELREALQAAATDKLDSRRLGWWMRQHRDRIVDGLALQQDHDSHQKVAKWIVRDQFMSAS